MKNEIRFIWLDEMKQEIEQQHLLLISTFGNVIDLLSKLR